MKLTGHRRHMSHVSCLMCDVSCFLSHVVCLMSHVSCLMCHFPCLMSHVSCFIFHVSCFMSHVSCFMSHVACFMFHVSCLMSHVLCFMSHVSCLDTILGSKIRSWRSLRGQFGLQNGVLKGSLEVIWIPKLGLEGILALKTDLWGGPAVRDWKSS